MNFETIEHIVNLPLGLLSALCLVESGHKNVVSPHDGGSPSYGICQVKLATARLEVPGYTAADLMDRNKNAYVAGKILKRHFRRYGNWCHAVAAYNAGRLNLHVSGLPRNVRYVRKVERALGEELGCL